MEKQTIKINESQLRKMVSESVKKVLKEVDFSAIPRGDFNERNKWWKTQADTDFPNHGVKDSKDWYKTYNNLSSKQKDDELNAEKAAKMQALKDKEALKQRKKNNLFKALNWALEGTEEGIDGYEEYLRWWPIVYNAGNGKLKKCKMEVSDLTTDGYGGIIEMMGRKYSAGLHDCEIYIDRLTGKIGVDLDSITGEDIHTNEPLPEGIIDIEQTKEAIRRAFTKKVKENLNYLNNMPV